MSREHFESMAIKWLDYAYRITGRSDTQTALMYAQVYATLAVQAKDD